MTPQLDRSPLLEDVSVRGADFCRALADTVDAWLVALWESIDPPASGAALVAVGGYGRQVQITVDPNRLAAYGLGIEEVADAVRRSNDESGGRLIEWSGAEAMVRVRGYARDVAAFESIALGVGPTGVPVRLGDVARVAWGPEIRRGVADFDGRGDHVGGIVVMRHGENAKNVIVRVRDRIAELGPTLPEGVEVVSTYDRSTLIDRAIATLKHELTIEMIVVSLVILLFLWHLPSAIVPILTIPISVLLSFIPLYHFGITVNIMSLAGIAISIGVLVDGAIVEVENAYNKIHLWDAGGRKEDFHAVRFVYRARCPRPTRPVVHDVGGSTADSRWVPLGELEGLPLVPTVPVALAAAGVRWAHPGAQS